jgi:hypothetical protein
LARCHLFLERVHAFLQLHDRILGRIGLADRISGGTKNCLEDAEPFREHPQWEGDEIAHDAFARLSKPGDDMTAWLRLV